MSFPILLNINNQVSTHQFRYRFSQPIDFSQFECALGSISIFYNWKAITALPSTTTTYQITLPDGTYTASDINNYLQYWSIQNNLYLINNTTGDNYYFISCTENVSAYAIQFTMNPVKNITGYTAASGMPTMPATADTPQLIIDNSGFGSIVGLNNAMYPLTQQTSQYVCSTDRSISLSNPYNPIANNNQVFHAFTSAGVGFGGLITTCQGQGIAYCPMKGTNNEITLSFMDQNMQPLQIIDPNVCIRLLMRQKSLSRLFKSDL
ncbi:hypothetical protein THRCLA_21092 [Thraustotheca clavata]|uniref:Uncharacterized protein n=1 Tax=Thraustotheca clavata TaxID=74557 RepID=A0A1W0A0C5_9STRA|nr:hypothetical protein THRCLA_21092 [Thraustotheca clavata]